MVWTTLVWLVGIFCALYVIIDVLTNNKRLSTGMKVLWIVLALFFSIITAIVYYFVGRAGKTDFFK